MIEQALEQALELIKIEGTARLLAQGHDASGNGIKSLRLMVDSVGKNYKGYLFGEHYLLAQETGIKGQNYVISKQLIENLTEWLKKKNFSKNFIEKGGRVLSATNPKTYRKIAFAIAKTHKLKGMHTRDGNFASQYQGWLSSTLDENQTKIRDLILKGAKNEFEILINTMIQETNRNIGK